MLTNTDILVIDVETTGIDPTKHACIELAAMLLDRDLNPIAEFSSCIAPWEGAEIQPEAMAVNKINLDDLRGGPSIAEIMAKFNATFQPEKRKLLLCGWNPWFDMSFLKALYTRIGQPWPFRQRLLDMQSIVTFHPQSRRHSHDAGWAVLDYFRTHR